MLLNILQNIFKRKWLLFHFELGNMGMKIFISIGGKLQFMFKKHLKLEFK